jgi:hypothetical protein
MNKTIEIPKDLGICGFCENISEAPEVGAQVVWGKPQPPIIGPKTFYCDYKMRRIQYKAVRRQNCQGYTPIDGSGTEE